MKITVFSEYGEGFRTNEEILKQHPRGLHETLRELFEGEGFETKAVYQDDHEDGGRLTDEILVGALYA